MLGFQAVYTLSHLALLLISAAGINESEHATFGHSVLHRHQDDHVAGMMPAPSQQSDRRPLPWSRQERHRGPWDVLAGKVDADTAFSAISSLWANR
jgi:hypothetical protein